ncbi:RDD family protein [Amycolatopsis sp. lyj-112]|uniref:RDD family protein n=1 Tax=Amycolatopsis sp. lyj-112 TaxID=2789288 RepID=UPI00397E538F
MTVSGPSRPRPRQETVKLQVERLLGPRVAKRVASFRDGAPYVEAKAWVQFLAWLVDFVVLVLGAGVGIVVLAVVDRTANLDNGVLALSMVAILFLVPLLYGGACYRNGRALGAVLTGTRLVRVADGGRIGAKAPWAMLVRTILMPLLLTVVIGGALAGGGGAPGGSQVRVSVDVGATGRLRECCGEDVLQ